jgi:hypothetical protein
MSGRLFRIQRLAIGNYSEFHSFVVIRLTNSDWGVTFCTPIAFSVCTGGSARRRWGMPLSTRPLKGFNLRHHLTGKRPAEDAITPARAREGRNWSVYAPATNHHALIPCIATCANSPSNPFALMPQVVRELDNDPRAMCDDNPTRSKMIASCAHHRRPTCNVRCGDRPTSASLPRASAGIASSAHVVSVFPGANSRQPRP